MSPEVQSVRRMLRRRVDRECRLALGEYGPAFAIDRHRPGTGHLVQTVLAGGLIGILVGAPDDHRESACVDVISLREKCPDQLFVRAQVCRRFLWVSVSQRPEYADE